MIQNSKSVLYDPPYFMVVLHFSYNFRSDISLLSFEQGSIDANWPVNTPFLSLYINRLFLCKRKNMKKKVRLLYDWRSKKAHYFL